MTSQGYIDLHLHALPGIDDGVRSVEAAVEMLSGLKACGFDYFVTTPHRDFRRWFYSDEVLMEAFNAVRSSLAAEGLTVGFELGAEYTYGDQFHAEINAMSARTIGQSRYVLLELPEDHMPSTMAQALFQVGMKGYHPILAHPERCRPFQNDPSALVGLASGRALIQVSFRSLAGTFGRRVKRLAWTLVEEGYADLVATDCHSPRELKKVVRPVMQKLGQRLPEWRMNNLMREFPLSLLNERTTD